MNRWSKYIERLLRKAKLIAVSSSEWKELSGDGSDRQFFRIGLVTGGSCLAVFPSVTLPEEKGLAESNSAFAIGNHLISKGVSVPRILAYDKKIGGILFEDLGDTQLFDIVRRKNVFPHTYYRKALDNLVHFQVEGVSGFKASYCWDTPNYDRQLMLSRESGYFLQEFCADFLGVTNIPHGLDNDFKLLADQVSSQDCRFLLHRDYQSRNLMIHDQNVHIIDFQGARFGPLGYDVASLLNDPYVDMSQDNKAELFEYYLDTLVKYISLDRKQFIEGYYHIALQRNLQVLGAYAFLSQKKKKDFFKEFIAPAFNSLVSMLHGKLAGKYTGLESLINDISDNHMGSISGS